MPIQLKRSAVAGKIPTTAQIALGELAVNTHDGRLFLKRDDGTEEIVELLTDISPRRDPDNRIINGSFDFWQRGTSGTLNGYPAADHFGNIGIGGTVTQSRQAHTLGDKFGSNSPSFYLRQSVSGQSAAGDLGVTFTKCEGVRTYAGETITVLGWVRRSSGSGNMAIEAQQEFGTGGSPSAGVSGISPTTITLTTDWEPFAAVINVPSIAGKTIGSNNNDSFRLDFWTSAGSDLNARTNSLGIQTIGVDLWGIHIKRGTHTASATDFYRAPELGPELARCQRYFQRGSLFLQGTHDGSLAAMGTAGPLSVHMRANPTVALTLTANGGYSSGLTPQGTTFRSIGFNAVFDAGNGVFAFVDFTADAEL